MTKNYGLKIGGKIMKSKKLLIALLSVMVCFSFAFSLVKTEKAVAAVTTVTVEDMLQNTDDLRPAFNHGGAERLSVTDGVISPWNDGHFFYCEEVDAVTFNITFTAGSDICFALRTDGNGQMWTSHGYYAYVYQVEANATVELYKVTDCSAWQTVETQLKVGSVANVFDGNSHTVGYSFDETTGALTFTVDGVAVEGVDNGEHIAKANSNFKISRVNSAAVYTVSAKATVTEPDDDQPTDDPVTETKGIAITNDIMLKNPDKLLPAFNYSGVERCNVANGQISSWSDGNFFYRDEVDSASFTFTAGEGQSMLFVGLHLNSVCVPWASTGYFAFIQDMTASVYKVDADDLGSWTGAILGEAITLTTNVYDGETHAISFAVSGKTLTFKVDNETLERTFTDESIAVENTEFGLSSNGTGAFLLGESTLEVPVVEKDYEGEFTNIETLIAQGAIRADYNYDGDFHCVKSNGYVEANEYKMSINATITAIDFDIVVTTGSSVYVAMRATKGGAIWEIAGYAVWLDGTTLKFWDLSTGWHDAPDLTITNFTNIFDGKAHNIKMYAFDDDAGYVQIGFSVDGGEWVRYIDTTDVLTLDGHTEVFLMSVNDNSVRFKVGAPEGTQHAYGDAEVTDPTCTEDGYTCSVCADCGKISITDTVGKLGHNYSAIVTEPTCLADGFTTYTCERCSHSYVEAGEGKLGHSHKATVVDPTCSDKGYTLYVCDCGDQYMENFTDELGHDLSDATCEKAPTCQRENCDYTEGEALGHNYGEWVVEKEATEEETGLKTRTCDRCGDVETEEIPVKTPTSEEVESSVEGGCLGSVNGTLAGVIIMGLAFVVIKRKQD